MFDLIVSGGRVIDGSGSDERIADIGIRDGQIVAIEAGLSADAAEVIDATDRLVTPGFVDCHAHYDGQMTWDDLLEPSSSHGVTTVVTGNCGVGFAPVRPGRHEALIELMEGVEDIPGAALSEGITWEWESFPEYLDALSGRRWSMDVATQLPHGPLRSYVRGDRPDDEAASPDELRAMTRLVSEAIEAGAYGLSTSRTLGHRSLDGSPVPGTSAGAEELLALGAAVASAGGGVFEVAVSGLARSDHDEITDDELDWIGRVATETGLTTTFIVLQVHNAPERWRSQMDAAAAWRARGAHVVPLIAGRPFATLWGWDVRHPFLARPSYRELAGLPLPARLEQLRRSDVRHRILTEPDECLNVGEQRQLAYIRKILGECFPLSGVPDYEPPAERSLASLAE
ncbi:MAG: amidohydrolase family protein, partial [Acidimicrobiia bacterium]